MSTNNKPKHEVKKEPIHTASVMFTPFTPQSQLLYKLKQVENKVSSLTGDKIQHVERAGTKLRFLLVSPDPWRNVKCSNNKCLICTNPLNNDFSCRKRNVSYKTYCLKCAKEAGADEKALRNNVNSNIQFYFGETFRDATTRGAEHLADYVGETDDSHMLKHLAESHPGSEPKDVKFGMTVVKQHKSSFDRQIFESVLIYRGKNVLNSRSEFNRCQVPRLSVMTGEDQLLADNKVETKKSKKFNNFHPPKNKRRKVDHDVEEELMEDKVKKVKSDTIDNTETPQDTIDKHTVDVVPHDEENLKFFQPLNPKKRRKPYPTKMNPKNQCNGQTKISSFFSNTRTGKRRFSADSTSPSPT